MFENYYLIAVKFTFKKNKKLVFSGPKAKIKYKTY